MAKDQAGPAAPEAEAPPERSHLGEVVCFRLGGVDMAAIVTQDRGERILDLTVFPPGQPQMARNHVTPARLPNQENVWRPL